AATRVSDTCRMSRRTRASGPATGEPLRSDSPRGGLTIIGVDPADRRGREEHNLRPILGEPREDRRLGAQVERFATEGQDAAILSRKAPHPRRSQHAGVARNAYPPALKFEIGLPHRLDPCGVSRTERILSGAPHSSIAESSAQEAPRRHAALLETISGA